jgi:two-component system KDP operon response regulator KdpE
MRATLRSVSSTQDDVFTANNLRVDLRRREVLCGEITVKLTATEYDLLKVLIHHGGNVRTHRELIHDLLRVSMSHLRRKLRPDPMMPRYIVTEPGVGYRRKVRPHA